MFTAGCLTTSKFGSSVLLNFGLNQHTIHIIHNCTSSLAYIAQWAPGTSKVHTQRTTTLKLLTVYTD